MKCGRITPSIVRRVRLKSRGTVSAHTVMPNIGPMQRRPGSEAPRYIEQTKQSGSGIMQRTIRSIRQRLRPAEKLSARKAKIKIAGADNKKPPPKGRRGQCLTMHW